MSKMLELNSVDFEVGRTMHAIPSISRRTIWDCYSNPSDTKEEIYEDWKRWFIKDCDSLSFGVKSYNCNFFTIEGLITVDDQMYYIYITRAHNRAYPIELLV